MLETLNDPEIRRMSIETPEEQFRLDPEQEFTEHDWAHLTSKIESMINPERAQLFAAQGLKSARWALEINPDFDVSFIQKHEGRLLLALKAARKKFGEIHMAQLESEIRRFFPSLAKDSPADYTHYVELVNFDQKKNASLADFEVPPLLLHQIILKNLDFDPGINEWELGECRRILEEQRKEGDWEGFLLIFGRLKELLPNFDIPITKEENIAMYETFLEIMRIQRKLDAGWVRVLEIAAYLRHVNLKLVPSDKISEMPDERIF